jgi:pantoate--beta-alanine ligase
LFNIVNPQIAVFGQKDAQQVLVLKKMVHDLNLSVNINVAPIIRENSGLALSSRNKYLTDSEKGESAQIYKGLCIAEQKFADGERSARLLSGAIENCYKQCKFINIEYIEIVDIQNVQTLETISTSALIAVACRTTESKTRLIDNIVVGGAL